MSSAPKLILGKCFIIMASRFLFLITNFNLPVILYYCVSQRQPCNSMPESRQYVILPLLPGLPELCIPLRLIVDIQFLIPTSYSTHSAIFFKIIAFYSLEPLVLPDFLCRRTDGKLALLLLNRCPSVFSVVCTQIHLVRLCRELARLQVDNLSIPLPLQRGAADWCLSECQESGALWRALTRVPSLLSPDSPLIQLHHSGNSISSETQLSCLSPHLAAIHKRIDRRALPTSGWGWPRSLRHCWLPLDRLVWFSSCFWLNSVMQVMVSGHVGGVHAVRSSFSTSPVSFWYSVHLTQRCVSFWVFFQL